MSLRRQVAVITITLAALVLAGQLLLTWLTIQGR